jgi:hypothetical protein
MTELTWSYFKDKTKLMYDVQNDINTYLKHPVGQNLMRSLKKEIAPFLILRDLYEEEQQNFESILSDEKNLEEKVERICRKQYDEINGRLKRAATRSVIYIFITKMVFALGIEYPFEQYVLGKLNLMALGINTIFPPFLMLLALQGISAPGTDNTNAILNRIKDIIYRDVDGNHRITLTLKVSRRRPLLKFAFSLLYIAAFIFVFGGISFVLTTLHFSIVSQFIFVFFISVILFFAYRIRQTGREYQLTYQESVLTPLFNVILLPILNVGKWLSSEVARLNFFIAFFDYLIEAPFKTIFEIFEEWFSFMRKQKEEIL